MTNWPHCLLVCCWFVVCVTKCEVYHPISIVHIFVAFPLSYCIAFCLFDGGCLSLVSASAALSYLLPHAPYRLCLFSPESQRRARERSQNSDSALHGSAHHQCDPSLSPHSLWRTRSFSRSPFHLYLLFFFPCTVSRPPRSPPSCNKTKRIFTFFSLRLFFPDLKYPLPAFDPFICSFHSTSLSTFCITVLLSFFRALRFVFVFFLFFS